MTGHSSFYFFIITDVFENGALLKTSGCYQWAGKIRFPRGIMHTKKGIM